MNSTEAVYCCTTKIGPVSSSSSTTTLLLLQQQQLQQNYSSFTGGVKEEAEVCSTSAPPAHFGHMDLLPRGSLDSSSTAAAVVRPNNTNNNSFKPSNNKDTITATNRLKIPISSISTTKQQSSSIAVVPSSSLSSPSKKFHSNNSTGNVLHVSNKNCNNGGTTKNARLSSRSIQLGNLVRTKLYSSFPNLHNHVVKKEACLNCKWYNDDDENVRKVLKAVASDHVVSTPYEDNKIRRTVYIERLGDEKFGFIIQSYAFRRRNRNQMEQITYVDYVALDGPAFRAGLRAGDVILAINGKNIQNYGHTQLVRYIGDCKTLRMVVLFENCVNRVELCTRAIKLKKLLSDKEFEMKTLLLQEDRLLKGLPVLTQDEILTLLRTPSNSPSLERISRTSHNRSSIQSDEDGFSSISVASTSYDRDDDLQKIDESNPNTTTAARKTAEKRYSDSSGVKFVVGGGGGGGSETNSSKSNRSIESQPVIAVESREIVSPVRVVVNVDSASTLNDTTSNDYDSSESCDRLQQKVADFGEQRQTDDELRVDSVTHL